VSKLTKQETQGLAIDLKQQLEQITRHCVEKIKNDEIEYAQNDFSDYNPYVVFHGNSDAPIFIFPPGDGGAESYFNNLVPFLDKKHLVLFNNFYWYLSEKFGASAIKHYTYEKLALEYIAIMKTIQPTGPYNLLGWSFGGVLAFEVARQLCSHGDHLHKLVMIDSYFDKKNVIKKLRQKHRDIHGFEKNINDMYCPKNTIFNDEAMITLYKATQVSTLSKSNIPKDAGIFKGEMLINEFYVNKTKDNCISSVLKKNCVKVEPIEVSHYDWILSSEVIKKIADELLA
jgi:hypothetical protein